MIVSSQLSHGRARRKAIAGLIAGLLIVALIFTVGVGFFFYQNGLNFSSSQAAINKDASNLKSQAEDLSMSIHSLSGASFPFGIEVANDGGTPLVLSAVFVSNPIGTSLTQYMTEGPSLNLTLPMALEVGYDTTAIGACGTTDGYNIGISSTALPYSTCTTISPCTFKLLTSSGNIYSAVFPTPSPTTSTETDVTGTTTVTTGTTLTSSGSTTTTILTTSSQSGIGFDAGTNSLEVTLQACAGSAPGNTFVNSCTAGASTVYNGGEVILVASVTNLATTAMNVYVSFQSIATNQASLSTSSPAYPGTCSPSPASGATLSGNTNTIPISPGTTGTFDCTFSANTGPYNSGAVTFVGFAVGSFTIPPAPPETITSAESTSNTLQLGNPLTNVAGPWLVDYFSFQYASSSSGSWQPAAVVSHSNQKVIFQVTVTNTASSALTITGYSYILVGRISQEMDYYVVSGTTYSSTLAAFTCTNTGPGGAPTGSSCITVPVGGSQTVDFAACSTGGTGFMWYNSGGGPQSGTCSSNNASWSAPEGAVMFVVIVYEYQSGGNWVTFSQSIPAQGIFVS